MNNIRDKTKIKFEATSSPHLIASESSLYPVKSNSSLRNNTMTSIFSKALSKAKPQDFQINTKISPRTKEVFNLLNQNIEELITYHTQLKRNPASKNLLTALHEFRSYAIKISDNQLLYEIQTISKLPFKKSSKMDNIDQHINPYETYTNTEYNMDLIKFLLSIRNYESIDEYLYKLPAK